MRFLFFVFVCTIAVRLPAQPAWKLRDSVELDGFNRFIDHAVVKKDRAALDTVYAEDFSFTHGTGHFDTKATWLAGVLDPKTSFLSREHDSTVVEVHKDMATVYGRLTVVRAAGDTRSKYAIRYLRVYRRKPGGWEMVSHRTVQQWDNLPL